MQVLRNKGFSLAALGLFTGFAVTSVEGCGEGGICGPCGSIETGQLSISGDAKLDGFFKAVADFQGAVGSIRADFDANIIAIAEAWGVVEAGADVTVDSAFVTMLTGEIRAELMASIEGGVSLQYQPPRCEASLNVAVEAQASCEANAGCDCEVDVDPGELSVACEGQCSGGCSAECTGMVECKAPSGGISCEGSCEGTCELTAAASCDGTCEGTCTAGGDTMEGFSGRCDGMCEGTCEVSGGASCSGTCHGTCIAEADPGGCEGEVGCRGECSGECSGSCEGNFEPPRADASCECEASADCNAQASAQAEANIECTPPSLELVVNLAADLQADASLRADFLAKLDVLKVRGAAILQGTARLQGLINGDINGDGTAEFSPAPLANLQAEMQAVVDAGLSGEFEIPPGKIDCVIPALRAAVDALVEIGSEGTATVSAQVEFSAFILNPAG